MEFVLRCNDLKCRTQLHDRAVVTTCSHVFCSQCADSTGLSRAHNGNRQCPACGTALINPDDVVVAGLNPSEDYKTSVLSGLSPTVIMECASRGLAFYSYQSSQEIVYQEHLAKSLTEKYTNLNQQMDQLIHEANAQIKGLQDKIQSMQVEQASLEHKNHELSDAFRDKARAQQQIQKLYQSLKAQVMASHVANAAGDEADYALHTARPDRSVERLPGTRTGTANLSQFGVGNQQRGDGRRHNRDGSGSSGGRGDGQHRGGGIGLGPAWNSQAQAHGLGGRVYTGRESFILSLGVSFFQSVKTLNDVIESAPVGTPGQVQPRSRLPVLGGQRNPYLQADAGPSYQASPSLTRQPLGVGGRNVGGFGFGTKASKRASGGGMNANLGGR
ncbi:hypothetical protein K491DRAFT_710928 [Lophiostoma macrostomum CBS 122681]|uniref:RING-type domain-containing protein n=1 Tax=Lophiostoma macrostomum CBS 122681 TaxID=1314788 RepID=A0A6A6TPV4_9PLEO|nr:hypothetical protein K491DRAFT_710928 [Lophiostoma macrostomum CBS 122681]